MLAARTQADAQERSALLEVESYGVFLDLTAGPYLARSRSQIRFRCRKPGADTFADLAAARVDSVILNGTNLDPSIAWDGERLRLPHLAASNVLTLEAQVPYTRSGRGLARFTEQVPDAAEPGGEYVMTYCYPTNAPQIFGCFDQLDLRADLTLSVRAPAGWECVANAPVVARPAAGAAGTWRFAAARALKPYDLALLAGPYVMVGRAAHDGPAGRVDLTLRCRATLAGSPGMDRVAGLIRDVLGYYEGLLGVSCPYAACEIVFAPDLGPQAACLPGVVLVSEKLLQRLADPGDEFAPMVLAHEMAHLWFGGLVEGRWWDDLWLAEAVASYLAYQAAADVLGQRSPWADFAMQGQAAAYRADSLPSTRAVSSPVLVAADALSRPNALTYSRGASVIRQLAALIGDDALRAGFRDYLTRYAWRAATLDDLVGCWTRASGRDLSGWARQWLRTAGVSTLSAELALAADGTVASLAVRQEAPGPTAGGLRTHRIGIGVYDRDGGALRRRAVLDAEISGARTDVPGLAGQAAPDAVIVNDGDLTFARIALDERTMRALAACALEVGDPLTEAVCWNAVWDTTMAGELSAAGFTDLVIRRLSRRGAPPGLADLLGRAGTAADFYAGPAGRPGLRERLAAAALDGAARAEPGGQAQRALALAVAVSAESPVQLGLLRSWLGDVSRPAGRTAAWGQDGGSLPAGLAADPELRGQILATLAGRGLATDADLDALAAADPVGGRAQRATCRARRPDPAAKEAAWAAAIAAGQPPHLAEAHARGIWVPGQEALLAPYRDRFFGEALPALIVLAAASGRNAQRLARLLYPALLADPLTLAATRSALDRDDLPDALGLVLVEQGAILGELLTARGRPAELSVGGRVAVSAAAAQSRPLP